jgi:hypothetical protein
MPSWGSSALVCLLYQTYTLYVFFLFLNEMIGHWPFEIDWTPETTVAGFFQQSLCENEFGGTSSTL